MPIDPGLISGLKQPEFDTSKFVNLIAQGQQRKMQQETHAAQMQEHQQRISAGERAAKAAELKQRDDEISRTEFVKSGGDLDKWEQGLLQNGASAEAVMNAQKHRGELLKQRAENSKTQNELTNARDKRMQGVIQESQAMAQANPELYQKSWGQIYGAIKALDPEVAQHLDESTPLSAEQWQPFGLHYASQDWADAKVKAQQAAAKEGREIAVEADRSLMAPAQREKAIADASMATATAAGNAPIQPAQQAQIDQQKAESERQERNAELSRRIQQRGQEITIRGQDMSDSRARDMADATRENRPVTAAENRALGFYTRAQDAAITLDSMESEMAKKGLFGQASYKYAPNFLQSDENQVYRQAQRAFTEARLRKDSGAAIPPNEYVNDAKTYFPEPGDGEKVLAQKKKARETLLNALHLESGRAVRALGNEPGQRATPAAKTQAFVSGGVTYNIPEGEVAEFLGTHSDAKKKAQ